MSAPTPVDRFFAKVMKTPICWLWTAGKTSGGYGMFGIGGRELGVTTAHRWSYEYHVGPIPPGLQLDHLCRVRHCVNPMHLEPVTRGENLRRANRSRDLLQARKRAIYLGDPPPLAGRLDVVTA